MPLGVVASLSIRGKGIYTNIFMLPWLHVSLCCWLLGDVYLPWISNTLDRRVGRRIIIIISII